MQWFTYLLPIIVPAVLGAVVALLALLLYAVITGMHLPWTHPEEYVSLDDTAHAAFEYRHLLEILNVLIDVRFEMSRPAITRMLYYPYSKSRQALHKDIIEKINSVTHALESYKNPEIREMLERE